jgi:hypothetical protein
MASRTSGVQRLADHAVAHAAVVPVRHPRLGVEIAGQAAVRYLRFLRPMRLERLELPYAVAGRWIPAVPTHPAHLTISVLDRQTMRWETVREVTWPPEPRLCGAGLRQRLPIARMEEHFRAILASPPRRIALRGLVTDHLRVVCDREHPVWPNHGECNGGEFGVPFGLLAPLSAHGRVLDAGELPAPAYLPGLRQGRLRPQAPPGMAVSLTSHEVHFSGPRLTVGFSLVRPLLTCLGWDASGGGAAATNRLLASRSAAARQVIGTLGGLSGPCYRLLEGDFGALHFTGAVEVEGATVHYRDLELVPGLRVHARFTVTAEALQLELEQTAAAPLPALEAEPWRFTWNLEAGMTSAAGVPLLTAGRNGRLPLPALITGDDGGALRCTQTGGDPAWLQVDSSRPHHARVSGLALAAPATAEAPLVVPAGTRRASFVLTPVELLPPGLATGAGLPPALRRSWGALYSSFRPELGGYSNHAASVHCHVNQWITADLAVFAEPQPGFAPLDLARYTIGRALLDGGGYGYHRALYLDSDPILVAGAGRLHQLDPDPAWLARVAPGLREAIARMLGTLGRDGLVVCRALTGNAGSYRWSSNAMDVVGFGHLDAYVNAWTYRGLRNATALAAALGEARLARRCRAAASRLQAHFADQLVNPDTGWVAGWRSRDGELHDYAFMWVNGPACAFGLLPPAAARAALAGLEVLRRQRGPRSAEYGLPFNLLPIRRDDQMLGQMFPPWEPLFENYTDGAAAACGSGYYLRALALHGLTAEAADLATELERGYAAGYFRGGSRSGVEFRTWDGLESGYEGTFGPSSGPLYGLAIARGVLRPTTPEWWPTEG